MGKVSPSDTLIQSARKLVLVPGLAMLVCAAAHAASFEPAWGRDGMIATSVSPAAAVGQRILEQGGNAVDAAIAASFAAAVAHPFSSGIGGGLFAVVHDAQTGATRSLDARETAPAGASAEFYRKNPDSIRSGAYSVGVPGMVQGAWALHQAYATMPWKDLIEPAIRLAEEGVTVSVWHHNMVAAVASRLDEYPETRRVQTVDGVAPPIGWTHRQPDLGTTLRLIQEKGEKALAVGPIAKKIEESTGGVVTELDLARYAVKWREPVRGSYRGYEIIGMPPPSSGGVLIIEMLNILERYDLAALGKDSSEYIHLVASAMKLAFEDRAQHLGDTDFYPTPVTRLISREYADQQAARISPHGQPQPLEGVQVRQVPDDSGTTQISVMDRFGNAVSITQTINTLFGSKITVPGTGIVLNNEMDDFSVDADTPNYWEAVGSAANAVAPGKRPLSSMTPMILFKDGRAVMVIGSPQGTMIISAMLHSLLNVIDFGFDAQRAVQAPRFHHQWQPDRLLLEPEFPLDVRRRLQELGYELADRSLMGAAQLVVFDPQSCMFWGGSDGRRDSAAAGANARPVPLPAEQPSCQLAVPAKAATIPH